VGNSGSPDRSCTLIEGASIVRSAWSGDVEANTGQGVFYRGARLLSQFTLRINGAEPEPLSTTVDEPFTATFVGRVRPSATDLESNLGGPSLVVVRRRFVGQGLREDLVVQNDADEAVYCEVEIELAGDFAELVVVRDQHVAAKPTELDLDGEGGLRLATGRGERRRGVHVEFRGPTPLLEAGRARFETLVPARGRWEACLQVAPIIGGDELVPRYRCGEAVELATPTERLAKWRRGMPTVVSDHPSFAATVVQSVDDLGSLRIFDPERPESVVVAAGVPWAMDLYGRDALLTGWMALLVDPDIALGVLETLARFQGTDIDPRTEEEPGRIIHRLQFGSSSPRSPWGDASYCSVDATPLFVMLLGELRRWGLAPEVVDRLLPHADRALAWIDDFGDRDGDGYVEYARATRSGLVNQGWKDSPEAVRDAAGRRAPTPIALCEVQGYVYAALLARSHFADEAGDLDHASQLRKRAVELRERFNEDFWLDEHGWLAMALDGDKQRVEVCTSNMGHCLWTGILDPARAALVAEKLLSTEMFTGWGVRTLAQSSVGYDPLSYHDGSVWPHDNALLAAGLMRYGHVEAAHRVITAQLEAARSCGFRLPELFSGLSRTVSSQPIGVPSACVPQAWAAAAPLLFLRTLLRLEPWMPQQKLWLAPALPEGTTTLRVERIPLLGGRVTVDVDGDDVSIEGLPSDIELLDEPRAPLTALHRDD
jgi:glycogen debranching enzyme